MIGIETKIKSVMLGHAIGDAIGVPVEFYSREELKSDPVKSMEGGGTYSLPAGCWSDDTSMSLCALESLSGGKIDWDEIVSNFGKWYYNGEYTPTGVTFDVGNTCSFAIENYFEDHKSVKECGLVNECSNGNGSLMRIHPFVLYAYTKNISFYNGWDKLISDASALTHSHARSKLACLIYTFILMQLLEEGSIESVRLGISRAALHLSLHPEYHHFMRIFDSDFEKLPEEMIKSGGYVVDTLEASLWCLLTTKSYEECVLKAVNLGDDTDTVTAIAGGLAGALYGFDSIPAKWLNTLKRKDYIENICVRAANTW